MHVPSVDARGGGWGAFAVLLLVAILVTASVCCNRTQQDKEPGPSQGDVKSMLAEAASMAKEDFVAMVRSGGPPAPEHMQNQSLTLLVMMAHGTAPRSREHPNMDFSFLRDTEPGTLIEAIWPSESAMPTVLREEYVTGLDCTVSNDSLTGVVSFRADDLYEGQINFRGKKVGASWSIVEFELPRSRLRLVREGSGWKARYDDAGSSSDSDGTPSPQTGPSGTGDPGEQVYKPVVAPVHYEKTMLILASSKAIAAVDFTDSVSVGVAYRYRCLVLETDEEVKGAAKVFEKYEHKQVGPDRYAVQDAGGQYQIVAGPIEVQWSWWKPGGCWLYYRPEEISMHLGHDEDFETVDLKRYRRTTLDNCSLHSPTTRPGT